jgi:hypothetical protein
MVLRIPTIILELSNYGRPLANRMLHQRASHGKVTRE